jgi:hypothetical protein
MRACLVMICRWPKSFHTSPCSCLDARVHSSFIFCILCPGRLGLDRLPCGWNGHNDTLHDTRRFYCCMRMHRRQYCTLLPFTLENWTITMSSRNTRPRPCRKWPMAAVLPLVRITRFPLQHVPKRSAGPACGKCFNLTLLNTYTSDPPFFPDVVKSIVIKVTDLCPLSEAGWCSGTQTKKNPCALGLPSPRPLNPT